MSGSFKFVTNRCCLTPTNTSGAGWRQVEETLRLSYQLESDHCFLPRSSLRSAVSTVGRRVLQRGHLSHPSAADTLGAS